LTHGSTLLSFPGAPFFRGFGGRVGVQAFEAQQLS
jgi:hypothetical protein